MIGEEKEFAASLARKLGLTVDEEAVLPIEAYLDTNAIRSVVAKIDPPKQFDESERRS